MQQRQNNNLVNFIALTSGMWAGYSAVNRSLQAGAHPYFSISVNLLQPAVLFNIPTGLKCFLVGWAMGSLFGVATINQASPPITVVQRELEEQKQQSSSYRTHMFP